MESEIENMRRDLALKGYAQKTQRAYVKTIEALCKRFGRDPSQLTREDLREYVAELQGRGDSASTLANHLGALLFLYRKTLGRPDMVSFVSLPKKHRPLPQVLSQREVDALLKAIRNPRYQAIAMVLYGAGLRISEALVLEVHDIDGERGVIRVRHGKGDNPREAKLSPALYRWLREYWRREQPRAPHLFASSRTGKLPTAATIRDAIAKAAKDAWIKKHVTPHMLRHTFATHLLEEGTDVNVIRALLGHSCISTTVRYAQVTRKLVRQTPSPLDLLPQRRY
jgi:site-specific recombinase XerD